MTFTDVTAASGLAFVHDAGLDGSLFMPEIMGGGGALLDADGDDDLDVLLLDGGPHGFPWRAGNRARLFLQDDGRFRDATAESGLSFDGYAMGAATGDVDNDGDLDLFVTAYGPDALFLNDGHGRFEDATGRSPDLACGRWGASAAFFDYDLDGWLDLYVTNYLAYDPAVAWVATGGRTIYCAPDSFAGTPDCLFRNLGNGRFEDVSRQAGITAPGKGLGVVTGDFTGDGLPDVLVANDGQPNVLWVSAGDGTFRDEAAARGVAVDGQGMPRADMGIACGDSDGDGDLDLYATHLTNELNTLWCAEGPRFRDRTEAAGLGAASVPFTGFGTAFADFDHDGDLDLALVNGRVFAPGTLERGFGGENRRDPGQLLVRAPKEPPAGADAFRADYGEPRQLFENLGDGRFADATARSGAWGAGREVGRGMATGDVDRDGDVDVLVTNVHGVARLLRNDAPAPGKGHWLQLRVVEPERRRDAIGALVTVECAGRRIVRLVDTAGSYLTASEALVHVGLPAADVAGLTVRWPDGAEERFACDGVDRRLELRRGAGSGLTAGRAPLKAPRSVAVGAREADAAVADAMRCLARGAFRDAAELLDVGLRARPRDAGRRSDRALVRRALGDHAGEMQDLDRAVADDPRLASARINRAQARRASHDHGGAIADLDAALAASPRSAMAIEERALTLLEAGRPADALDDAARLVALQPGHPRPLGLHATILVHAGDPRRALALLDASAVTPTSPELLALRAEIRRGVGDVQGASADEVLLASLRSR